MPGTFDGLVNQYARVDEVIVDDQNTGDFNERPSI